MYQTLEVSVADMEETGNSWPVRWSAVWVGALAALASAGVFGLTGTAVGAASIATIVDLSTWKAITLTDTIAAICGTFFAFVIGGWVAGKIAGTRLAESSTLHGVIAWLIAMPLIGLLAGVGAESAFGGWYGGIVGNPHAAMGGALVSPTGIRHLALTGLTVMLVGLIGSVLGGWMASGEPMSLTHRRTGGIKT